MKNDDGKRRSVCFVLLGYNIGRLVECTIINAISCHCIVWVLQGIDLVVRTFGNIVRDTRNAICVAFTLNPLHQFKGRTSIVHFQGLMQSTVHSGARNCMQCFNIRSECIQIDPYHEETGSFDTRHSW
jgi:hypothetical protein